MNKIILIIVVLVLLTGLTLAGFSSETVQESKEETTGETREKIEVTTRSLIEESQDAKDYFYDRGEFPEETKTEVQTFEGTNTVFVTTYYANGKKATRITTKDQIDFIETRTK